MRQIVCSNYVSFFTLEECLDENLVCLEVDADLKQNYDQWTALTNLLGTSLGAQYKLQQEKQIELDDRKAIYAKIKDEIDSKKAEMLQIQSDVEALFEQLSAFNA